MISNNYITQWAAEHPWRTSEQVEQDLMLSRALVAIFSDEFLRERLAFRGGTALHKLYFSPQVRYSEDIDLVQIAPAPFGETFDHLKEALSHADVDTTAVMNCFSQYIKFSAGYVPTKNMFEENMAMKLAMPEFLDDTNNYLRSGIAFDAISSWPIVRDRLFGTDPLTSKDT